MSTLWFGALTNLYRELGEKCCLRDFILKCSLRAGEVFAAGTRDVTEERNWTTTPLQCVGELFNDKVTVKGSLQSCLVQNM